MGKRLGLLLMRMLISVNLLYGAILFKFAGVPDSVALFTQMSQSLDSFVPETVLRLASGAFEVVVALLLLFRRKPDWEHG